ncbi:MAG TPA: hypothetical protein VIF88_06660 [Methylocystis sp.]|jgi:hypothetical protein
MNDDFRRLLRRHATSLAIVALPIIAIAFKETLDEPPYVGPGTYALYAVSLAAYWAISQKCVPSLARPAAAGILAMGAVAAAMWGTYGTILGGLFLFVAPFFYGPITFVLTLLLAPIALSPFATALALARVSMKTLCDHRDREQHVAVATLSFFAGIVIASGAMRIGVEIDNRWLAPRVQAFATDDLDRWEQALTDIKENWACGHRRCLIDVCNQLTQRFGEGEGESGQFASPWGFAMVAPNAPQNLDRAFTKVYGFSVRQVCARGD